MEYYLSNWFVYLRNVHICFKPRKFFQANPTTTFWPPTILDGRCLSQLHSGINFITKKRLLLPMIYLNSLCWFNSPQGSFNVFFFGSMVMLYLYVWVDPFHWMESWYSYWNFNSHLENQNYRLNLGASKSSLIDGQV